MHTYIGLLRGINVGGHKKIKMALLKQFLSDIGLLHVETYIQSGNIVFESTVDSITDIEQMISKKISEQFDFEVPVLVMKHEELKRIYDRNPYLKLLKKGELEERKIYYTFLHQHIVSTSINENRIAPAQGELYQLNVVDKVVYLYFGNGYGNTKLTNNFFEKKLQTIATTRNFKTVERLLQISNR